MFHLARFVSDVQGRPHLRTACGPGPTRVIAEIFRYGGESLVAVSLFRDAGFYVLRNSGISPGMTSGMTEKVDGILRQKINPTYEKNRGPGSGFL